MVGWVLALASVAIGDNCLIVQCHNDNYRGIIHVTTAF